MLIGYKRGQGSIVLRVKILDSSVATGAGKTGLSSASAGLIISTIADNEATATTYTVAGSTVETITTLGTYAAPTATKCRFKEVDATNHKGVYEIQLADARFAVASAKSLLVSISGATNAADTDVVVPLRDLDPYDAVRAGLTALPNAAAEAAGGLYTRGTGAGQLSQTTNGELGVATLTKTLTTYTGNTPQTGDAYARIGAPVGVSISADVAGVQADTNDIQTRLPAALTADGNMKADTLRVSGTLQTAGDLAALIAALNNLSAAQVLTQVNAALDTALADSIPADGSLPTLRQAAYMNLQFLLERSVAATTVTVKKVDGVTALFTLTLNDGTTPTSITRTT